MRVGATAPTFSMTKQVAKTVDPDGLVTNQYITTDGELIVDYRQDVSPIFEQVKTLRNDPDYWRGQVKRNLVHAMHIPNATVNELILHGCNPYTAPLKDIKNALRAIGKYDLCDMTGKRV